MFKNKVKLKKIINIFLLIMIFAIIVGIYYNIRNSRAEQSIEIIATMQDKMNPSVVEELNVSATSNADNTYTLKLPSIVSGKLVTKYIIGENEIPVSNYEDDSYVETTINAEEVTAENKTQIQVEYDVKNIKYNTETLKYEEVQVVDSETITLYNLRLSNNSQDDVIVSGYMPLDANLKVLQASAEELLNIVLPNEKQEIENKYEISILTEQIETSKQSEDKYIYLPSDYGETFEIKIKLADSSRKYTAYEENETLVEITNTKKEKGYLIFTSENTLNYVITKEIVVSDPTQAPVVYNYLKATSEENTMDSAFLGNSDLKRQYIESITFVNNIESKNETAWDVSQGNSATIFAWYTTRQSESGNNIYQVYIGSNQGKVIANQDSSYLFSYIGYNSDCKETSVIKNIELLDLTSVTNMNSMFYYCGAASMTTLDLGPQFTKISNQNVEFLSECGKNGDITIFVGESIYSDENNLKLSANSSELINFQRRKNKPKV